MEVASLLTALFAAGFANAAPAPAPAPVPVVYTNYPYYGPEIPVGDWVDQTVNGNGKGFVRLSEAPAVIPGSYNPTNNINVIALSYVPYGVNVRFQTPFGLGEAPTIRWGPEPELLYLVATGRTATYERTPSCSLVSVTQCSQFFHDVQLTRLAPGTTYYYQIQAANGTTASEIKSFTTAREAGDPRPFTIAVINDMGYTNALGTYQQLNKAVDDGAKFVWHGGDISYADDWYSGILACASDWPVCYNGSDSTLPGGQTYQYDIPLPKGEIPDQGGPFGGDFSPLYESNWDLWQNWMNTLTARVPYMVLPGNHEAACAEFDGPGNVLTAYLNLNLTDHNATIDDLTYYSCPPSQRNFTAYQNRFRMPGEESGGVGNFWYSFDYGLAHFISLDTETDFANSPEYPFLADVTGNETMPTWNQTFITDSGPFGYIDGNKYLNNTAYEQYQWLEKDLASIDRTVTPWVIVNTHRPMYSTETASYQKHVREAFEALLLKYGVDAYIAGHIHWYERLYPLTINGTVDYGSVVDNNTYVTNPGVSMTHLINGMAGNIESHTTLDAGEDMANFTVMLDDTHYGFSKLTIHNESALTIQFIRGDTGLMADRVVILKNGTTNSTSS